MTIYSTGNATQVTCAEVLKLSTLNKCSLSSAMAPAAINHPSFLSYTSSLLTTLRKSQLSPNPKPLSVPFPNPQHQSQCQFLTTKTLTPNLKPKPSIQILPLRSSDSTSATVSRPQSLKSRLRNGETLYGIFLLSSSPTLAEIAGLSGYDFAVVDMEHGHGGISEALHCLQALAAAQTPAILRIPESSPTWAKKALDLGPQGIMFPMIDGPKSARKAVSYCRFPPNGIRGSAHTIVRASGYGIDEGYLNNYEEELLIMCQVECEDGVKKIDEISAVDGVDCVQMGPLDLSASMGYLWDPGNKKVREAMRGAEKEVLKGGKAYLAGFVMPHDGAVELRRRGYHMVSGTSDVGLFRSAAVQDVSKFKGSSVNEKEDDGKEADEKYWSE